MYTQDISDIIENAKELMQGEGDYIANAANLSALLFHSLREINWAGFYYLRSNELVLGPFQGRPACIRIPMGKGVCGAAAEQRKTIIVSDVHQFPGHIACDTASNSEIVVPIIHNDNLVGVLDIDSPQYDRFQEEDRIFLEYLVFLYVQTL